MPALGESVKQAILVKWHKRDGEAVSVDEPIAELETDKANVDVPSPAAGVLRRVKEEGDTVGVGEVIARVEEGGAAAKASPAVAVSGSAKPQAAQAAQPAPVAAQPSGAQVGAVNAAGTRLEDLSPAVRRLVEENHLDVKQIPATGPNGRLTKEDVEKFLKERGGAGNGQPERPPGRAATAAPSVEPERSAGRPERSERLEETPPPWAPPRGGGEGGGPMVPVVTRRPEVATQASAASAAGKAQPIDFDESGTRRVPMSKIRKRIAENLVRAQQTAAILTTFNEVDMSAIMDLRAKFKERFQEVHGVGLGFMSFFVRACVLALHEFPRVNAFLEGDDVVYHQYVHMGIAVSTYRGLAVPVLRHVERMSFARVESEIKRLAAATRDGKLSLEELSGGTFTITNGGIFGSMLSTPILNPPQSGILGMHNIVKRPVAVGDKVEVRPVMYLALSYDHRLVDGRESVSFLVRVKQLLEDPARLMLEI